MGRVVYTALPAMCFREQRDIVLEKRLITSFEEAVDYVFSVPKFTTKNTMADTKAFLDKLGNPDRDLKIIHVAGTNGKGSVCAYMSSVLEAAGKKVALFTSPHLVDVRERFIIDGQMVGKQKFLQAFLTVYEKLNWQELENGNGYHPTFFEYLFFMAMLLFREASPDYCILETGLGGRLDATNAVENKLISVITRISLEHVEYLGDTIAQIAGEKAGIMMENVPVVFSDVEKDASAVFCDKAKKLSCLCYPVSNNDYSFLNFKNKSIDFSYVSLYDYSVKIRLRTIAKYQMENCALALRAIEVLDENREISKDMLCQGVENCFWAGRMEEVASDIFVDGAHNADGVRAFLETVREDGYDGRRKLLFSVVADKDYGTMLKDIARSGLFEQITLAHMGNYRATSLEDMSKNLAEVFSGQVCTFETVKEAFEHVRACKKYEERIYIAGSLYLVGEIKEYLGNDKF